MPVTSFVMPDLAPAGSRQSSASASGRCFVGLPPIAAPGETTWLERALGQLLRRHEGILLLLEEPLPGPGDDAAAGAGLAHSRGAASGLVAEQTMTRWREVDAVRRQFERADQLRVQLAAWSFFADGSFVSLRSKLLTAFSDNAAFRGDVLSHWASQQRCAPASGITARDARAACLRAIEGLAVRLRVGELSGHHAEYGRSREVTLASRLYAGSYASDGLTVEELVGRPPKRVYLRLD